MSSSVKVKSIKKISAVGTPVYDISVPKYDNFVLGNGLVVHNCKPYQYLRSAIYEQRIRLFNKCDLLTKEAISLVRNNNTGKVDHEESGSKDQIDALCGSVFEASKYAEQYSFDYGDDIESTLEATLSDVNESSKQITIDFENELKRAMSNKVIDAKELDFGFGPSIPMANETGALISEGLMIW